MVTSITVGHWRLAVTEMRDIFEVSWYLEVLSGVRWPFGLGRCLIALP
jgi:hypothetical protein